jgi:hypothetical protein
MRRLAAFIAIFLLLTSVAPVLACVTGAAMSREDNACCRSMNGQCGDMQKTGCCGTIVRTDETPQIATSSPSSRMHWIVAQLACSVSPIQTVAIPSLRTPQNYLPPGLLTARITILRI